MRKLAHLAAVLAISLSPAVAEEHSGSERLRDGMDRLSEASRLLLEELIGELTPMVQELRGMIDDLSLYEMPEVLPNGDIIIRRKREGDAPPVPEGLPPRDEGEIDI